MHSRTVNVRNKHFFFQIILKLQKNNYLRMYLPHLISVLYGTQDIAHNSSPVSSQQLCEHWRQILDQCHCGYHGSLSLPEPSDDEAMRRLCGDVTRRGEDQKELM